MWWILGRNLRPNLIFGLYWNPQSQEKFFAGDGPSHYLRIWFSSPPPTNLKRSESATAMSRQSSFLTVNLLLSAFNKGTHRELWVVRQLSLWAARGDISPVSSSWMSSLPGSKLEILSMMTILPCEQALLFGLSEANFARGRRNESLQRSLVNFHF